MIVTLDRNFDDDARDTIVLLRKLNEIHSTSTDRKWQIRCSGCRYLGPWTASILYAAFLRGEQLGQAPKIKLPAEPQPLQAYCVFSGMAKAFNNGPEPDPDHAQSETIPLLRFTQASWNLPDGIIRLLKRHTLLSDESEDQVRTCVQEVTQNVVDHADSPIGGIISARYFEKSNEVRVGIVDRGVGIGTRLRQKHPDIPSTFAALQRVITGGVSSRSRPNNMGLGVSNLFNMVESAGGRICVISGDASAEVHPAAKRTIQNLDFNFPGTGVCFSLPLNPVHA